MDIDSLTRHGETILRCVLSQDTTEYLELFSTSSEVSLVETLPTGTDGSITKTYTYSSILDIGLRTRFAYKWLQGGLLQQPKFECEVRRKTRKARNTAAPGGAPSKSLQASLRFDGAASLNDDDNNIRKQSNVTVFWGRCDFGFIDKCYFYEDGGLALIDRCVAPPEDPTKPEYLAERASYLNEGKSRVNPQHVRPPVLDFSFRDLTDVVDLLRTDPDANRNKKGPEKAKKHRRAKVFVPKEDKVDERNITFNPGGAAAEDPAAKSTNVMIRAKNKKGEEEGYEFNVVEEDKKANADAKESDDQNDAILALSKGMTAKFSADSIRLCNNLFQETERIIPVLRSLVVDSVLTITWIDLSCNRMTSIPEELNQLHLLSVLYLHGNSIASWEPVRYMRKTLTRLHTVTLYGNPIATRDKNYKETALSILLNLPTATCVPLKSLDFVVVSKQDKTVTKMYEQFNPPVEKKRENAARVRERTQKLQATMLDF